MSFRLLSFCLLIVAGLGVLAGCVSAVDTRTAKSFTFTSWDGPALRVFAAEPDGLDEDAPVVFVLHGVLRNAQEYRDNWLDLAEQRGIRVYVPEFDQAGFPGGAYSIGAGFDGPVPFGAIEPLYAHIRDHRGANRAGYVLFGHSAGAQFAHRYLCFAETPNLRLSIAANAGWYTLPEGGFPWPYSLSGAPAPACAPKDWLAKPLLILLGDRDVDPNHQNLRKAPEAQAQGPHRLARGQAFYAEAGALAHRRGWSFNWSLQTVPGVAHDNAGMAKAAADHVAGAYRSNGKVQE